MSVRAKEAADKRKSRALESEAEAKKRKIANQANMQKKRTPKVNGVEFIARSQNVFEFDEMAVQDFTDHRFPNIWENQCQHCGAFKFSNQTAKSCCSGGKVILPPLKDIPEEFKGLFTNKHFLKNIRKYNNRLAMASLGFDKEVTQQNYSPVVKIQGKIYHRIGALQPDDGEQRAFCQIYIHDGDEDEEVDARMAIPGSNELDRDIMAQLQRMLHHVNPYVKDFQQLNDIPEEEVQELQLVLRADKKPVQAHTRTYNKPTVNEVAIIGSDETLAPADVVLRKRGGGLKFIKDTHRSFDPLHFVLLFPNGEEGWYPYLHTSHAIANDRKKVTPLEYFRYRSQIRPNDFNILKKSTRLYQEYVVVAHHKIKNQRLKWLENPANQKKIKADKYKGLLDAASANDDLENPANQKTGKDVETKRTTILPPTFIGSKRWYKEQFQDSMAIVRHYGKPHLFVTFTATSAWPEIAESLFEGQPEDAKKDRPDLVAGVFSQRLKELLDDILKRHVFGKVIAIVYVIEWQKRGLPHVHMLLTLAPEDDPRTPADIDKIISAQIPDPQKNPLLHKLVKKNMVHGPCGAINPESPCMSKQGCTKMFPKSFVKQTSVNPETGEVMLARPAPEDGGHTMEIWCDKAKKHVTIDNTYIVPYNPVMLLKYQGHMNIEKVNSVKAVKYCYMYLAKGPDRIIIQLNDPDEIKNFRDTSYTSASQAEWELQGNVLSYKYPNVTKLPCHLEGEQLVTFDEEDNLDEALEKSEKTKLTEFFRLNREDPEANNLTYLDLPRYYRYLIFSLL